MGVKIICTNPINHSKYVVWWRCAHWPGNHVGSRNMDSQCQCPHDPLCMVPGGRGHLQKDPSPWVPIGSFGRPSYSSLSSFLIHRQAFYHDNFHQMDSFSECAYQSMHPVWPDRPTSRHELTHYHFTYHALSASLMWICRWRTSLPLADWQSRILRVEGKGQAHGGDPSGYLRPWEST